MCTYQADTHKHLNSYSDTDTGDSIHVNMQDTNIQLFCSNRFI